MRQSLFLVFVGMCCFGCGGEADTPQETPLDQYDNRDSSRRVAVVDAGPVLEPDSDIPLIQSNATGRDVEDRGDDFPGDEDGLNTEEEDDLESADAHNDDDQLPSDAENVEEEFEESVFEDDHIFDVGAPGTWAQFEFNGGSQDVSGLGHDGTLIGGDFVDTEFGQGLRVGDASHGFDWSRYSAALAHPYTIEMVLTPSEDSATFSKILSPDDEVEDGWYLYSEGFRTYPINGRTAGEDMMPFGQRSYLAIVSVSPTEVNVYVNGQSVTDTPIDSQLDISPDAAIFFRDDGPTSRYETLHAVIDALRISSVSRTAEDVFEVQRRLDERSF